MVIGLTYDLRTDYLREGFTDEETAEFDKEETIAGIENALHELGYHTDRIGHARQLITRLAAGDRWEMVFNICEGLYGIGREAQVPAILDVYNIPYTFSDPMVLSLTLHKGMTKRVIRDAGLSTPDFAIIESEKDIQGVTLPYPLFVKPYAEGTGKGIDARSKVGNREELEATCRSLLPRYKLGLIAEVYLPGREFTVAIAGTGDAARALGTMEVMFTEKAEANGYSYLNKEDYVGRVNYRIVHDEVARKCADLALAAWRTLNCRDAGRIDIRLDDSGNPGFIEVNPLAGLNPVHSDLPIICRLQGGGFTELIGMIMTSALSRIQ
jgi:D-alanine-D-alanine ligase